MKNNKIIKYISYTILGMLLLVLVVTIGNTIKISNSDEYALAKDYLKNNKELIEEIGEIQSFGSFPSGSIRSEDGAKFAQIETDVEGKSSEVKVILLMSKQPLDNWKFDQLYLQKE
ncbi:cytochrome c oxidase assembly factor Coa1 family protein [Christiangramia sabulilitoris]|uniref:Uncharacterized protein n=1 Tax=Christiangramia sabulilitoris TaxID=2583991 RepID=A0A550I735_9FLAO|nr:cytochrome c oxidase assembly factor Coa1 family protein [Christiangramia sabulilitoris]TRO66779.1 hypothetical protein FGM01_02495 [Christiangramia sabulilitoris]